MKLEVGEYYLSASGEIVKIDTCNNTVFRDSNSIGYIENGNIFKYPKGIGNKDLIAHIPKQLLNHLVVEVNNYHTDNDVKDFIDVGYGFKH